MTKSDQIKILNDKIKANNAQYNIDRLNAKISAFSEGNLDKYEFFTGKDLKYKPNALDKAKFEFSPLGRAFNQGLDKKAENYKEEGVIKLLKDIRDKMFRLIGGVNDNRDNGGNNGDSEDDDDYGDDRDDKDDRYNGYNGDNEDREDKYLLKLDRLLKNLKDDKNLLKTFSVNIDDKSKEELEAEELDRRFKKLISKKRFESIREYFKKAEYIDPQSRVDALRKKLNNLPKTSIDETSSDETSNETSSDETSNETRDDNNDNDDNENEGGDSEDNDDRYNGNNGDNEDSENEYLLKLDRLLKSLKDDKKLLKTFSENIDEKSREELEAEELDRRFKNLISKKRLQSFKKYLKKSRIYRSSK